MTCPDLGNRTKSTLMIAGAILSLTFAQPAFGNSEPPVLRSTTAAHAAKDSCDVPDSSPSQTTRWGPCVDPHGSP